jgi:hypothetical protein
MCAGGKRRGWNFGSRLRATHSRLREAEAASLRRSKAGGRARVSRIRLDPRSSLREAEAASLRRSKDGGPAEAAAQGALLPSIEKSRPTRPSCAPALRGTRASLPPARPATARLATARLSPPTSIAQ